MPSTPQNVPLWWHLPDDASVTQGASSLWATPAFLWTEAVTHLGQRGGSMEYEGPERRVAPTTFGAFVIFCQLKRIFLTHSLNTFQLNFPFYRLSVSSYPWMAGAYDFLLDNTLIK